ncbi:MAG: sigma-70 family RNA polymerase sigma factor [Calditrichaeota bacterium]|nr:sigma-70 family RNA polymerase sigma factor [Calditrichota bacterium]
MKKDPDAKLVKSAKMGDSKAFGRLVRRYQKKVLYLAYDLVGNYTDAQDVAQNAFFQAFKNINAFQEKSAFSTWLYRITANAAIDFQRSKKRRQASSLNQPAYHDEQEVEVMDTLPEKGQSVAEKIERADLSKLIRELAEQLPPQQRAAFVLKYFHEKTTAEIAEILHCDAVTVRGHILRATIKLRKKLKEEK